MRLITWNCRIGGFRRKARLIAPMRPDVLAVQEVERIDAATIFEGDVQPTFRDRRPDPAFPRRAIGVFSYTGAEINAVDSHEPMYSFRRYEVRHMGIEFNVAAVWPWQTKSAATAYRQAHDGIVKHSMWIRQRPTVIMGDFNANQRFAGRNWPDLETLMTQHGLVSAYHRHHGIEPGKEAHSTHFHKGKPEPPFHLDYCFVPEQWVDRIRSVDVGAFEDWHVASDHAPLTVDLEF